MKTNEEKIAYLKQYCSTGFEAVTPFQIGEYIVASDNYFLVAAKGFTDVRNSYSINIGLLNHGEECKPIIIPDELLTHPYLHYLQDESEYYEECAACNGYGEVEYEFSYNGVNSTIESECPICEGEGGKEIKEIPDSVYVKIGNAKFSLKYVALLDKISKEFNAPIIPCCFDCNEHKVHHFKVGDLLVGIMPMIKEEGDKYVAEILIEQP